MTIQQGIIYFNTNGDIRTIITSTTPTLEEMQRYVEGYIEVHSAQYAHQTVRLVMNEEALLKKMDINWRATAVYHAQFIIAGKIPEQPLRGPVMMLVKLSLD